MEANVDRDLIEHSIVEVVRGLVERDVAVDEETTLAEIGLDSLGLVELALTLEERWPIELRPDDYDSIRTVGDVVAIVTGQVS